MEVVQQENILVQHLERRVIDSVEQQLYRNRHHTVPDQKQKKLMQLYSIKRRKVSK